MIFFFFFAYFLMTQDKFRFVCKNLDKMYEIFFLILYTKKIERCGQTIIFKKSWVVGRLSHKRRQ